MTDSQPDSDHDALPCILYLRCRLVMTDNSTSLRPKAKQTKENKTILYCCCLYILLQCATLEEACKRTANRIVFHNTSHQHDNNMARVRHLAFECCV